MPVRSGGQCWGTPGPEVPGGERVVPRTGAHKSTVGQQLTRPMHAPRSATGCQLCVPHPALPSASRVSLINSKMRTCLASHLHVHRGRWQAARPEGQTDTPGCPDGQKAQVKLQLPDSHRADGERAPATSLPVLGGRETPFPETKWALRREGRGEKGFHTPTQCPHQGSRAEDLQSWTLVRGRNPLRHRQRVCSVYAKLAQGQDAAWTRSE